MRTRVTVGFLSLPFVLLSMLAAGTMPVRAGPGTVGIVICAGDRLVTVAVADPDDAPPAAPSSCAWDDAIVTVAFAVAAIGPAAPGEVGGTPAPASRTAVIPHERSPSPANRGPPAPV